MGNALVIALIAALAGSGLYLAIRRLRRGSSCCGEREAAPRRVTVRDRNRSHYPFVVELRIGGMTCENCARRVENFLNSLDGTWAVVRIDTHTAHVRCKQAPNEDLLRTAVREAGYVVTSVQTAKA